MLLKPGIKGLYANSERGYVKKLAKKDLGKLAVFYGSYTLPVSLACLKFIQKFFKNSNGLYFIAGKTIAPLHIGRISRSLGKTFLKKVKKIPVFDPLSQFVMINMLDSMLNTDSSIEWIFFDNIIFNFYLLKGLIRRIKIYSLFFEEFSALRYIANKYQVFIATSIYEEAQAILPKNFLQKIADLVIRIYCEDSKIMFSFEKGKL